MARASGRGLLRPVTTGRQVTPSALFDHGQVHSNSTDATSSLPQTPERTSTTLPSSSRLSIQPASTEPRSATRPEYADVFGTRLEQSQLACLNNRKMLSQTIIEILGKYNSQVDTYWIPLETFERAVTSIGAKSPLNMALKSKRADLNLPSQVDTFAAALYTRDYSWIGFRMCVRITKGRGFQREGQKYLSIHHFSYARLESEHERGILQQVRRMLV